MEEETSISWVGQPQDNAVEVAKRLAKRVLELEQSYSYMKAYRDDLHDEVLELEDKVKENMTNAKHYGEYLEDDLHKAKDTIQKLESRVAQLEDFTA